MEQISRFATSYEINNGVCTVDGVIQATTQPCTDGLRGIFTILGIVLIPLLLIGLLLFVLWVITLIHVIQHEDIKDRTLWLVLLIVGFLIGLLWLVAPLYYFIVMRPYKKGGARELGAAPPNNPPQTPAPPTN